MERNPGANQDTGDGEEAPNPYRELFERSTDAILIIEGETFIDCNQAAVRMLGAASRTQVLQTHPSELSPATQPDGQNSFEKANKMIARAFAQGSHRFEWDHQRVDGTVFPVEVLLTAISEEQRQVLHVVWRDIGERKRLEQELRQAQKMEAIGQLAGGIAHDFNNLLISIIGHATLLQSSVATALELESANEILRAGERASELTKQLLAFGRKQVLKPTVFDLNAVLPQLDRMLGRILGEQFTVRTQLSPELLAVRGDQGQIEQVVVNLLTNARDAMPSGGTIQIRTDCETLDAERSTTQRLRLSPGEYAVISVEDQGQGMEPQVLSRIFDPFFTTKDPTKGSGLGMSTAYGIIKQSGGDIAVRSHVGHGTTVRVYLPRSQAALRGARKAPAQSTGLGGHERILLVEDENTVAMLMQRVLKTAGYSITRVHDGSEALERYQRTPHDFDLIVSDVVMPNMDGAELQRQLRAHGFAPRILFVSGYTNNALMQRGMLHDDVDLLEKPFTPNMLLTRVRAALGRVS